MVRRDAVRSISKGRCNEESACASSQSVSSWSACRARPGTARRCQPAATSPYIDPVGGLTLDDAIARALEREPSLRAARTQIDVAQGARMQAELRPNPSMSFVAATGAGRDRQPDPRRAAMAAGSVSESRPRRRRRSRRSTSRSRPPRIRSGRCRRRAAQIRRGPDRHTDVVGDRAAAGGHQPSACAG